MIQMPLQIEGTWEQIAQLAPSLNGQRLRLIVLPQTDEECTPAAYPSSSSEQVAPVQSENPEEPNAFSADFAEPSAATSAEATSESPSRKLTITEKILAMAEAMPAEERAKMPVDLADQHDHYIYGWPKK